MIVGNLLKYTRRRLDDEIGDQKSDKLWKDDELIDEYGNYGLADMCRECRGLIFSSNLVNETLATGTITLAGSAGSITEITVNDVAITDASVPFNGTIEQTATDLASNITAYTSVPNYTASASGAVVTISAVAGTGSNPNEFVLAGTLVTLTATYVDMSGGIAMCRIYTLPDKSIYDIDPRILEVVRFKPSAQTRAVMPITLAELDRSTPDWENSASGEIMNYIPDADINKLVLYPAPATADTVNLRVYRLPLTPITALTDAGLAAELEIPALYHHFLIPEIMKYAFEKNDEESFKPGIKDKYEAICAINRAKINAELLVKYRTATTNSTRGAFT